MEIIIIVICFGLAGSMIWQYALPPTEEKFAESAIADWQIYRNEEYGFEIKYPNLWLNKEFISNPDQIFGIVFHEQELLEKSVDIQIFTSDETIESFAKNAENIVTVERLLVDNYPALLLGPEGGMGSSLVVFKDGKRFTMSCHYSALEIWREMLSGFKLFESSQPYIKLISPNEYEEWNPGKSYIIHWKQQGLEEWGDNVVICLEGIDKTGKTISAENKQDACFYYDSFNYKYTIGDSKLTEGSYQWTIPKDIFTKFEKYPSYYKMHLAVLDTRPAYEGENQWEGLIASDASDGRFNIISDNFDLDMSNFLIIPFETCGVETFPEMIKKRVKESEEEAIASHGWVKNIICKIDLDGDLETEEYVLQSDDPGQNAYMGFYKIIDGEWKIIFETDGTAVFLSKTKKNGFYGMLFNHHLSAGKRYWDLYEWANDTQRYEMTKEWVDNN